LAERRRLIVAIRRYRHWPILAKILTIPIISFVIILIAVEIAVIPFIVREIMEQKKTATRQAVEVAYGILELNAKQARDGKMPQEEAQRLSIEAVKGLRYSEKEYFWINDTGKPVPKMITHPTVTSLDGKVLDDPKFNKATSMQEGLSGKVQKLEMKNLFESFVAVADKAGHGFVTYEWPKPITGGGVTSELYTKLSYVKKFEPWGWIIGSGIYVDNVAKEANVIRVWVYAATVAFSLVLLFLAWSIGNGIKRALREVVTGLTQIASGDADLTQRLEVKCEDESGELATAFNTFLENLHKIISMVMQNATLVAHAAVDMKSRSSEMAQGAERVAMDATTVATACEEMSATSNDIASNCVRAVESSQRTSGYASDGSVVVNTTINVMNRIAEQVRSIAGTVGSLGEKSNQIGAIVGTIQDIADQTNLLALNAAIEAARAGEQGRGFAVVADEVRALADRTSKATREISAMIKSIQAETQGAVEAMNQGVQDVQDGTSEASRSGEALQQILSQVDEVTLQINQIATSAEEQTATTGEISGNIVRITEDARKSSQYADETISAAKNLNSLAEALISAINRFRTIIKWNDRMTVTVRKFDDQHKQLVMMIQKLNEAMKKGEGEKVIRTILSGLVAYADSHFKQEEAMMQQHNYPDFQAHKQLHDDLRSKVGEVIIEFEQGRAVPAEIMTFLSDWLINHIMKVDKKYGEFFSKKGILG
jgi:methyl-accepting chemotaxis protein